MTEAMRCFVRWKSKITGVQGRGQGEVIPSFENAQLREAAVKRQQEWVDFGNKTYPEIEHWIDFEPQE